MSRPTEIDVFGEEPGDHGDEFADVFDNLELQFAGYKVASLIGQFGLNDGRAHYFPSSTGRMEISIRPIEVASKSLLSVLCSMRERRGEVSSTEVLVERTAELAQPIDFNEATGWFMYGGVDDRPPAGQVVYDRKTDTLVRMFDPQYISAREEMVGNTTATSSATAMFLPFEEFMLVRNPHRITPHHVQDQAVSVV